MSETDEPQTCDRISQCSTNLLTSINIREVLKISSPKHVLLQNIILEEEAGSLFVSRSSEAE